MHGKFFLLIFFVKYAFSFIEIAAWLVNKKKQEEKKKFNEECYRVYFTNIVRGKRIQELI